jgi:hypothetical protein
MISFDMKYVEDLKCESNADIGLEDIFEIAYGYIQRLRLLYDFTSLKDFRPPPCVTPM